MSTNREQHTADPGKHAWHGMSPQEVLDALEADQQQGLSNDEAAARRERYGPNSIHAQEQKSGWTILLSQFTNPLIYVLIGALVITLGIREFADAIVIAAVLLINATIGFLQEYKAESAVNALMKMVNPKARVRRDGKDQQIESDQLVAGDIVLVSQGQVVPADIRVLKSTSFQVNEAPLTGEPVPVSKSAEALDNADPKLSAADKTNMAFLGTAATSGSCEAIVVAIGPHTEIGQIAEDIQAAGITTTPLQMRIHRLANWITGIILGISVLVIAIGLLLGENLMEMLLLAVALTVAAIPEGLPIVVTVALAIGVRRMAKRHAVIRHLPAVDTLGSCDHILSDKTGTLTQNRMTVQKIVTSDGNFLLPGDGEQAEGGIRQENDEAVDVKENKGLYHTLLVGMLCNDASLPEEGEAPEGDPMEIALLQAASKADLDMNANYERYPRSDSIPFRTEQRFMATIHDDNGADNDGPIIFVKGSPERLAEMCSRRLLADGSEGGFDPAELEAANERMAAKGLRVLAMAIGRGDETISKVRQDAGDGLTFVGLQGLLDPPRESAVEAVDRCAEAGIRVIMVTGDHATTAAAISKQVHIGRQTGSDDADGLPPVITGTQVNELSDEQLSGKLKEICVFARMQPRQKLRLVDLLKEQDAVVAVTGDGVNDAPALKSAHLGVAMGSGTDVAKEASDMVITDDNFASVYAAVEEGRTAFRNIRMATFFLLSTGVSFVLIILGSLIGGWPLPLLPAQILWCNVVTNGVADLALAFEPGEEALYRRKPRPLSEGILDRRLIERLVIIGIWLTIGTMAIFYWQWGGEEGNLNVARTAALTTLVLFQAIHVFNCRSEQVSIFKKSLLSNKVLLLGVTGSLALHAGAIYLPWTQGLLRLEPLSWSVWLIASLVALTAVIVNELHKRLRGPSSPGAD